MKEGYLYSFLGNITISIVVYFINKFHVFTREKNNDFKPLTFFTNFKGWLIIILFLFMAIIDLYNYLNS